VLGQPAIDPAIDLVDLDAGRPLAVAANRREGRRLRTAFLVPAVDVPLLRAAIVRAGTRPRIT
jgi:hypothetical protein